MKRFTSFREFYPFYLGEHANRTCRRLHFAGSTLAIACVLLLAATGDFRWLLGAFAAGYGFAWAGHFFFEHNRPATFKCPLFSFMGDWRLWWQTLSGRQPW